MPIEQTVDYVVIGGGSAGCVLANRLSALPQYKVALLEAGPPDTHPCIRMPLGIVMALRSKKLNWHFQTTAQSHCHQRKMNWPRGRTLGGSSAINAMCYIRGNAYDFDQWAEMGNSGWSYADVLPIFKKIENFMLGENTYHGVQGPLNVNASIDLHPLASVFIQAAQELGYPSREDFNGVTQEGVGYYHVNQHKGRRWSNAQGYLYPIKDRTNLSIFTDAQVMQILFSGKKAIGVRYRHGKQIKTLWVKKEVILTAGAINTPQLLLLSGVGPAAEITKHGIPLVHDLPGVGQNLQDHLDIHISCLDKTRSAISFNPLSTGRFIADAYRYLFKRSGTLTSAYTQAGGFIKSQEDLPAPDLQWHFAPSVYTNSGSELTNIFKYYGYTLMTCLLNPASRGKITLKNSDPFIYPLIDPNYLSSPSDLTTMLIGFKKARELLSQTAFKPYFAGELEPGSEITNDEQIIDYIRRRSETIYHPVGTCKMGVDALAVVDPVQLKVHGLENLRVIDASIMPTLIRGNTNAATTMIAEKGAQAIIASQ